MSRTIGDVAEEVLSSLVVDQSKVASVTPAAAPVGEVGQSLMKVASLLRTEASSAIDYNDLAVFRVTYGV